ncbi:MAG: type II secretion system protein [Thiotrichales bacterium]|nr:type II secretion system protein [Thiotrichales bacterium]
MSVIPVQSTSAERGFSLLELVIALVVLGLMVMLFNGLFKLIFDTDKRIMQLNQSLQIQEAMQTYIAVNFRLPCPDSNGDGSEDANGSACAVAAGGLPYKDLGVKSTDAWGNGYFYQTIAGATDSSKTTALCQTAALFGRTGNLDYSGLHLCSTTNEAACDGAGMHCPGGSWVNAGVALSGNYPPYATLYTPLNESLTVKNEANQEEDTGVVAVIISWGANGDRVNETNCSDASPEELENCNNDINNLFVKTQTGLDQDYLTPITLFQAKKAMIASRRFK